MQVKIFGFIRFLIESLKMNSEALKDGFSMLRSAAEFLVDHFNGKRHDFLKQKRIFEAVRRDLCDVLDKLY